MANTVRSRKQKGYRFQKAVATRIQEKFNLEERDAVSAPSSCTGVDVILSERAKKVFPFSIECKNQESISIWKCLEQMENNEVPNTFGLLAFKRNRSKPYVCMSADSFWAMIDFYKQLGYIEGRNQQETI